MKIALVSDSFVPSVNGVVSGVLNYSRGLVERGHDLLLVVPDHPEWPGDLDMGSRAEVLRLPSVNGVIYPDLRLGMPTLGVYREVTRFNPEVIHTFSPGPIGLMGLVWGKRTGKPVVYTHGTKFDDKNVLRAARRFDVGVVKRFYGQAGTVMKRFLNMHTGVVVSTGKLKRELVEKGVKVPIQVVRIPVPVEELRRGRQRGKKLRKELGIKRALLYSGRLSGDKRLGELVRLFAGLAGVDRELKLVIIGDGLERERLFELASELGVLSRMVWVGELSYEELVKGGYYCLGDVSVTMSLVETEGLATVEAMACGLVPVGVKEVPVEEVIGEAGLVVGREADEEMVLAVGALLKNRLKMSKLRGQAEKAADEFTIGKCSENLEKVYERVVK